MRWAWAIAYAHPTVTSPISPAPPTSLSYLPFEIAALNARSRRSHFRPTGLDVLDGKDGLKFQLLFLI